MGKNHNNKKANKKNGQFNNSKGKTSEGGAKDKDVKKKKTSIEDYWFYTGSSKQLSDFDVTLEFIINHIREEVGNDMAETLENLEKADFDKWMPVAKIADEKKPDGTAKSDAELKIENRQLEIVYQSKVTAWVKRVEAYEKAYISVYATLWKRCAKGMQNKLKERKDFESSIHKDPIKLLQAIKEHALNYHETRYDMCVVLDAYRALFNTKQKEGEHLSDFTRRLKTAFDVLQSHTGDPFHLTKQVEEGMKAVNAPASDKSKYNKIVLDRFLAYLYMENADPEKYGSVLKGLKQDYSLDSERPLYPKTIMKASEVLSEHPHDNAGKKKNKEENKNKDSTKHEKKNKEDNNGDSEPLILSFTQLEGRCHCCGKTGHRSNNCWDKEKIPQKDWAINKAKQHEAQQLLQTSGGEPSTDVKTGVTQANITKIENAFNGQVEHRGWAGYHACFYGQEYLKNLILLDSDSTETIFCNPKYVTNIRSTDEILELGTNGGPLRSNQKCDVPHLGTHWFNEKSITNIISLAHMADKYTVKYDSSMERAFLVYMPGKIVKFRQLPNGLYGMDPRDPTNIIKTDQVLLAGVANQVSKLGTDEIFLSKRQQARVDRARKLYRALGTPTVQDLKAVIRMNMLKNNEVTTEDVNLMEKVYGPDVGVLKGRTTRKKPPIAINHSIEIPEELLKVNQDVTLSIDGITVNSLKFLTTISHDIYYRTATYLENTKAETLKEAVRKVIDIYKKGRFNVVEIHCDNEFHASLEALALEYDPPIRINFTSAQEHVPRAERNNRTIKDRVRMVYHRLPYDTLPKLMVKYLVSESARQLNYFPNKNGLSQYYSPRMILHQENLDFNLHGRYAFGDYVQAHDEPGTLNTNAPRSLDCLYLCPIANHQGGHALLHLQTNRVITRRECTLVKLNMSVINQVKALALEDKMPVGLKFFNKVDNVLYDYAVSAGVDSDDASENEEDSDSDDEESHDEVDVEDIADVFNVVTNDDDDGNVEEGDVNIVEDDNEDEEVDDDYDEDNENEDTDDDDETSVGNIEEIIQDMEQEIENGQEILDEVEQDSQQLRRSARIPVPNPKYAGVQVEHYDEHSAKIIGAVMMQLNEKHVTSNNKPSINLVQTYSLNKGLKKFGEKGKQAALKEMKQLHDRQVWKPIKLKELSEKERKRAMESLIFLTEKRDGTIKARTCANGSTQRSYTSKDEAASPTAATEAILITGVIEAKQKRDIMTLDIPNAFVQTDIPQSEEKIVMKIRGPLVKILIELDPETYKDFVQQEKAGDVIYVQMMKALYGMMVASVLYYKKFRKDVEEIGFVINPYDVCVANRIINESQQTITWHVDDVKSSHVDPNVNKEFHAWCEQKYGSAETGHVKVTRGKIHDYLAMILDYSEDGVLRVDMKYYVQDMVESFPYPITGKSTTPWGDNLFKVDSSSKRLDDEKKAVFHTYVMKAMFLCKRARPDVSVAICFLSSRVQEPNEGDWKKLLRVLAFLRATKDDVLRLEADDTQNLYWFVDAAFAVHGDMRSHTGAVFSFGKGAAISDSTKQKVNSRSSTEAELNAIDDKIAKIIWVKKFVEAQGFKINLNIIYQDNESTMKLAKNGKNSSGKRTRHFDIKLFYVTDLIDKDEVVIEYCPTEDMIADYMTKALLGFQFHRLRDLIMNLTSQNLPLVQQECVGRNG